MAVSRADTATLLPGRLRALSAALPPLQLSSSLILKKNPLLPRLEEKLWQQLLAAEKKLKKSATSVTRLGVGEQDRIEESRGRRKSAHITKKGKGEKEIVKKHSTLDVWPTSESEGEISRGRKKPNANLKKKR